MKNLRFTQGMLEALSGVEMMCRETKLTRAAFMESFIGGIRVPALKIGRSSSTSATEF